MNSSKREISDGVPMMDLVADDVNYYLERKLKIATRLTNYDAQDWEQSKGILDTVEPNKKLETAQIITNLLDEYRAYLRSVVFPTDMSEVDGWKKKLGNILSTTQALKAVLTTGSPQNTKKGWMKIIPAPIDFSSHVGTSNSACIPLVQARNGFYDAPLSNLEMKQLLEDETGIGKILVAEQQDGQFIMGYAFGKGYKNREATGPFDVPDEHLQVMELGLSPEYIDRGSREFMATTLLQALHSSRTKHKGTAWEKTINWKYTHLVDGITPRFKQP